MANILAVGLAVFSRAEAPRQEFAYRISGDPASIFMSFQAPARGGGAVGWQGAEGAVGPKQSKGAERACKKCEPGLWGCVVKRPGCLGVNRDDHPGHNYFPPSFSISIEGMSNFDHGASVKSRASSWFHVDLTISNEPTSCQRSKDVVMT